MSAASLPWALDLEVPQGLDSDWDRNGSGTLFAPQEASGK